MAYLLASPNTRARVARTQALVLLAGGTLLTAYCTALAVGCAAAMFPGALDVPAYLVVNAGLLCLHLALGGVCFFASCLFNESRLSVAPVSYTHLEVYKRQTLGWGAIVYLAAISNVDPQYYEAAKLDGASRLRQIWSITLPCICLLYTSLLPPHF